MLSNSTLHFLWILCNIPSIKNKFVKAVLLLFLLLIPSPYKKKLRQPIIIGVI